MPAQPITATTQAHLNIEDIKDNLVLLTNGAAALVLQVSAVNFGLLSEQEQDAIIYTYAGLLNSLTFPIQILVRSKPQDISHYLDLLKIRQEKQKNALHQQQIQKYRQFIESLVKESNILDKKFYVSIPFSALELGIGQATEGLISSLKPTRKKQVQKLPFPKDYIIQRAITNLEPKRDHLSRQFNRIGLRTHQLNTQQLIELFFDIYNPDSPGTQLTLSQDYAQPLVQPAVKQIPQAPTLPSQPPQPPVDNPPPAVQN